MGLRQVGQQLLPEPFARGIQRRRRLLVAVHLDQRAGQRVGQQSLGLQQLVIGLAVVAVGRSGEVR